MSNFFKQKVSLYVFPLVVLASQLYKHFEKGADFNYTLVISLFAITIAVDVITYFANRNKPQTR